MTKAWCASMQSQLNTGIIVVVATTEVQLKQFLPHSVYSVGIDVFMYICGYGMWRTRGCGRYGPGMLSTGYYWIKAGLGSS